MKKVEFITVPQTGIRVVRATDPKYILLSDYLADSRYPDNIQSTIDELKLVHSGEKTFEEVFEDVYGTIPVGVFNGEFECDKDTAYFIRGYLTTTQVWKCQCRSLLSCLKSGKHL